MKANQMINAATIASANGSSSRFVRWSRCLMSSVWSIMIGVVASGAPGCTFAVAPGNPAADANKPDAAGDGRTADAAVPDAVVPLGPFSNPMPVPGLNTLGSEDDPTLTGDMLEIYFDRNSDIYFATRATVTDAWSTPQLLSQASSAAIETTPEITLDGLELFFSSTRGGGAGGADIYVVTRPNRQAQFGSATQVGELNSNADDVTPTTISNSALVMYMSSGRSGGAGNYDLYRTTRPSRAQAWTTPAPLPELATAGNDTEPWVDPEELTMYFSADGLGSRDIYMSARASTADPWGGRAAVTELNTLAGEEDPWVSPDGHTIYFMSSRTGNADIYTATR